MSNFTEELTVYDIQKWVKDLLPDTNIPDLGSDCMKILSNIIFINKEAEKDAEEIIKTESYLANLYATKSDGIMNNFSQVFSLKDLQPDICEYVKKIASVAINMKLKEPTITNFLLSSFDMDNKRADFTEQEIVNLFTLSKISNKITDVLQKNAILERDIEMLGKKVSKQQSVNLEIDEKSKFFKFKAEEYKRRIKKTEKQLKCDGWNTNLSHSELVKRSEAIQSLEHKVANLSLKLESYQNLPPNEMLTQLKIEEAQAELLRLQNEFNNMLKVIC